MAAKSRAQILVATDAIRNETGRGANRKSRIADLHQDVADSVQLRTETATRATFASLSTIDGTRVDRVHLLCHTDVGDGGGGTFDVIYDPGASYVANGGTIARAGNYAVVRRQEGAWVNVDWFGARSATPATTRTATLAAFAASAHVKFSNGVSYQYNEAMFIARDGIIAEFGSATIVNGGCQYIFNFGNYGGDLGTTYRFSGLKIYGGDWVQLDPWTDQDRNYIIVRATRNFEIAGCRMRNTAYGGIQIQVGCKSGSIDACHFNEGMAYYPDNIAIVLSGSNAVDYGGGIFVDWQTCERNAVPLPVYCVEDVTVTECTVDYKVNAGYGIYAINTRNCAAIANKINLGIGGRRAIAIHNYSPGFRAIGNQIHADSTATGFLITQCATGVVIAKNRFTGDFGTYRTIVVSTMADALIDGNYFEEITDQHIYVCANGSAVVQNNQFSPPVYVPGQRAVWLTAVDRTQPGDQIVAKLASVLTNSGVIFKNNTLKNIGIGVEVETQYTCDNGNQPSIGYVICKGNDFLGMTGLADNDYPVVVTAGTGGNVVRVRYEGNSVLPYTAEDRNRPAVKAGTAYEIETTDNQTAVFDVDVPATGGAIVVTKVAGAHFGLSATRSTNDLVLTPRTQAGAQGDRGALAPVLTAVVDHGGSTPVYRAANRAADGSYTSTLYDSAGVPIALSTAAARVRVVLASPLQDWSVDYSIARYLADIATIVGAGNITTLWVGDDITGSVGDDIASIPVRTGSTLTAAVAGRAKVGNVNSRRCAIFAIGTNAPYLCTHVGSGTNIFVAQYTGAVPTAAVPVIHYDPSGLGGIQASGSEYTYPPTYQDRTVSQVLTTTARTIGRVTAIVGQTYVGGVPAAAAYNFGGNIWAHLQTSNALTAAQIAAIHSVNRRRYPFLLGAL